MGAAGPWALLAAAIVANEVNAGKTGYRPDSKTEWAKDVMTLDNAETDFTQRYPRKMLSAIGVKDDAKQEKILNSPTGKAYTANAKFAVDVGQGMTADAVTGMPGAGSAEYAESLKDIGKFGTNVTKMNNQAAPRVASALEGGIKKPIKGAEKAFAKSVKKLHNLFS